MKKLVFVLVLFVACKTVGVTKKTGLRMVQPVYTVEQLSTKSDSVMLVLGQIIDHYIALDKNFYVDSNKVMRFKSFVQFDSAWIKYLNIGPNSPIRTNPHDGDDTLKTDGLQIDSLEIKVEK